ncbi:DUF5677 domain-containing protein [Knoellia sp. CPCC 206453]|uniref:DUF5677 domain-containing protein n=1 Tax=Knoellia pratensis TaxID=3404796 RepID=UPI003611141F
MADSRQHIETMIRNWKDVQVDRSTFRMGRPNYRTNEGQFAMVYAYCAHVHATADAYLVVLDVGPALVATPLARVCYEMAITAQWIAQTPDGYRALNNEEIRSRVALVKAFRESASEVFQEGATAVAHADASERLESDSDASARNFEQLCLDLAPGGKDAYAIYRAMSMESHPNVLIADQWIDPPDDEGGRHKLRIIPKDGSAIETWSYMVAASLVWSGRALDYFDRGHRRRSFLRTMAREVGAAETLQLSDIYRRRIADANRARRAAPRR